MLNYIRAEIYKLLRRKYTYVALGVILALEGLFASMFAFHNTHDVLALNTFGSAIIQIVEMGGIGFCACVFTGDIVFAGQYKNSTLKNEVSFGLSRTQIYLGKLLAQTLLSLVYLAVMMAFFIGLCAVVLPIDPVLPAGEPRYYTLAVDGLTIVGYFLAAGIPLWSGAQAVLCMCQFLFRGEMGWSFAYVGFIFVLPTVVELVGLFAGGPVGQTLLKAVQYFPTILLDNAKAVVGDPAFMGRVWLVGLFWVVLSTAIGLYGFHKKEIK